MKLMIVESPNKVKKIKAILGNDWDVAASVGHIRALPVKHFVPVAPDYAPEYEFSERGKDVVEKLKSRASRASVVFLATDPDREGEAIAWHLKEALNLRSYQRVTFDAITEAVIRKALTSPRQLDMNLVHAQEARQNADRLIGYKLSPVLSRQTGIAGLSAGRVQTPAVRLVVDRQREIDSFKVTKHFGAEATFEDGKWRALWDTAPFLKADDKYIFDQKLAEQAANSKTFTVIEAATKTASQAPPAPFTTATLLQAASVTLSSKPEQTADVAQQLFAQGLITYHRTDSQNLAPEALSEIRSYATKNGWQVPEKSRTWKAADSAQEAHEAIRPTHIEQREGGEDDAQKKLYALIWSRAVASQLADAQYSVNTLRLEASGTPQAFQFKAIGRTLIVAGWRGLTASDTTEETDATANDSEDNGVVPALDRGTYIQATSSRVLNRQTKPPSGYTQASLIKKLESEGIGRPSTYPSILKTVISRGYLNDGKKILVPTEIAKLLVDALTGKFAFVEYAYTRALEEDLDHIAKGSTGYRAVVSSLDDKLRSELGELHIQAQPTLAAKRPTGGSETPGTGLACPKCKKGQLRIPNGKDFYSCTQYREGCSFTVNSSIAQKKLTEKQIETLCTKGETGVIKGFISKQQKPFEAMLTCNEATGWRTVFKFPK